MIGLMRVEATRLRSRRLFRWLSVLALSAFAVAGTIVFFNSKPEDIFRFAAIDEVFMGLSIPFLSLAWLAGASAMGAEWPNRTITTLLTWEPRRLRVLGAKYVTTALLAAAWIAVLCALLTGVLAIVATTRGTFAGVDQEWLWSHARLIGRIAAGGAIGATLGLSLATIGRNTAAAFGVGFAYLAIAESLVRGFKDSWVPWLFGDNLGLFLLGPADVTHISHPQMTALAILLTYVAVLVAAAVLFFRAREVG